MYKMAADEVAMTEAHGLTCYQDEDDTVVVLGATRMMFERYHLDWGVRWVVLDMNQPVKDREWAFRQLYSAGNFKQALKMLLIGESKAA